MRRVLFSVFLGTLASLAATSALALGFGRSMSPTLLGRPLDFSAAVQLDADEALEPRCVSAEVMSGENRLAAEQVRVTLQRGTGPGTRIVRVTTLNPIDEPVVTVNVTLGCTSRVSRKFVTFLDPPFVHLAGAGEAGNGTPAPEPQRVESQVAPLVAMLQPSRPAARASTAVLRTRAHAARRPHARHASAARASRSTRLSAAEQAATRSEHRVAATAHASVRAAPAGTPRLQLEAARPLIARAPEAAASAAAPLPADASPPTVAGGPEAQVLRGALEQERERIRVLETGLAGLRADAQATRKSVAALQARLREAENERYANPLVYLLGGLCALLVAVSALALRRKPRKGASRWWAPTQQPPATVAAPARAAVDVTLDELKDDPPWTYQPARLPASTARAAGSQEASASSIGGLEVTTVIDHALFARMAAEHPAANELNPDGDPGADASTMESLIDLEQQAEFFVVLGQDEAAIALLSRHLRGGAAGPLPFFRLLEIHRRRGEEAAYARVAEAFHHSFGAHPASWDDALAPVRSLEDYPRVTTRLQRLWATPAEAMQAIEAWVFRRQPADEMLDAGACRELLIVHAVLRELLDAPAADGIDLLLPIDAPALDMSAPILVSPSNFAELYTLPSRPAALDLDISLDPRDEESERRKAI